MSRVRVKKERSYSEEGEIGRALRIKNEGTG
jgi:hypothetical protein